MQTPPSPMTSFLFAVSKLVRPVLEIQPPMNMWHCAEPFYSACCVGLLLSYVQRLLCGTAATLFTALAVWHCPYPVDTCCGVLLLSYYSGCCVALPLSCLQLLLCGFASNLCTPVAVWF